MGEKTPQYDLHFQGEQLGLLNQSKYGMNFKKMLRMGMKKDNHKDEEIEESKLL